MTMRKLGQDTLAFRRVWRALDQLLLAVDANTAYRLVYQVIYLRSCSSAGWSEVVRGAGHIGQTLDTVWLRTRVGQALAGRRATEAGRLSAQVHAALEWLIAEVDQLETVDGLFGACLDRYSTRHSKGGGDYYTPDDVAQLFAGLAAPQAGERVRDPACGSGRLLRAAAHWARAHSGGDVQLSGADIRHQARYVAAVHLALHGLRVELGEDTVDTLRTGLSDTPADVVITNPPVNMSDWGHGELDDDPRWFLGRPPRANANFAWAQHILADLGPVGRAVVLLSSGAARNTNVADTRIRRALVEEGLIVGIVALPAGLFPHTRSGTALWLLRKGDRPHADEILFADARQLGTRHQTAGRRFEGADVDRLIRIFAAWQGLRPMDTSDAPGTVSWCRAVSREDVIAADYDLTPARHVQQQSSVPSVQDGHPLSPRDELHLRLEQSVVARSRVIRALGGRA
ncbi:N-6 DNA methylase [Streptomyces sp. HUAS MG91]|uniref:N-6 DNA methylase n=1 Tax=Streptomyces tabacisoli TaxID=3156398 RepID=A0AAU8IN42_9ACTN